MGKNAFFKKKDWELTVVINYSDVGSLSINVGMRIFTHQKCTKHFPIFNNVIIQYSNIDCFKDLSRVEQHIPAYLNIVIPFVCKMAKIEYIL